MGKENIMVNASNEIVFKRIIKLLAITYAINEETLWTEFGKIQSIDKIFDMIQEGEIK